MTNNITNIVNYYELTRMKHSGKQQLLPKHNSIVSLELIEPLDKGIKVLINGKLFIAIIEEPVPLKEKILAWVKSVNKFSLTLNLEEPLKRSKEKTLNEILTKLSIPNNTGTKNILSEIIKEKKPIIESKVVQLLGLIKELDKELTEQQLILLINIVWNNANGDNNFAKDIIENLFNETFENVCEQFTESIKELLFTEVPDFLRKEISDKLIYNPEENNVAALTQKEEVIVKTIKSLNTLHQTSTNYELKKQIEKFIEYGSKYVLQKIVLNEYDYYPDFIAVKHKTDVIVINVEIKKIIIKNNEPSYTLSFKYKGSPVELNGFVKNQFLMGNIKTDLNNSDKLNGKIESFRKSLKQKWSINSNITFNNDAEHQMLYQSDIMEVNHLVS